MTKEEYKTAIESIRKEYKKKEYEVSELFAFANSSVKVGDIVTDHIGSVKVDTINWYMKFSSDGLPCCVYSGITLKKDGTETKRKERRDVYQGNLKAGAN